MTLFLILCGVLVMLFYFQTTSRIIMLSLISWGLLAANTSIGRALLGPLHSLSNAMDGWLR
ncbi:hypothetical protein [Actinomadura rupiterrae]|uniref:hypothetical protein n=1 Tax=Actinomadura rupiterrae TaxID=559627 RepID=UPI0020A41DE8|nr:hypothetical protein [Actinomadura rupiterrae]MCP2337886.1 hypothetical protein [Actinomadura rupiterrae]